MEMHRAFGEYVTYASLCVLLGIRFYYKAKYRAFKGSITAFSRERKVWILFRYAFGAMQAASLMLMALARDSFDAIALPLEAAGPALGAALRLLGAMGACCGLILLARAHQALGEAFSVTVEADKATRLVTFGPYRYVRHPMYLSYAILFAGLGLASGNWIFAASGEAVIASLAVWRRKAEEADLRKRFPDEYDRYASAIGAFIPRSRTPDAVENPDGGES
jgi:protein-S-isoprenylcysteine O-methyltransferase Ste14